MSTRLNDAQISHSHLARQAGESYRTDAVANWSDLINHQMTSLSEDLRSTSPFFSVSRTASFVLESCWLSMRYVVVRDYICVVYIALLTIITDFGEYKLTRTNREKEKSIKLIIRRPDCHPQHHSEKRKFSTSSRSDPEGIELTALGVEET